jgi:hypothetical protein
LLGVARYILTLKALRTGARCTVFCTVLATTDVKTAILEVITISVHLTRRTKIGFIGDTKLCDIGSSVG